jgi:hypothetical protein
MFFLILKVFAIQKIIGTTRKVIISVLLIAKNITTIPAMMFPSDEHFKGRLAFFTAFSFLILYPFVAIDQLLALHYNS